MKPPQTQVLIAEQVKLPAILSDAPMEQAPQLKLNGRTGMEWN